MSFNTNLEHHSLFSTLVYIYINKLKNIFNKNGRKQWDVKAQKVCKQGREVNVGPKIKQTTSIITYISTALCILFYSNVSTYVGLYGSGLQCC